MIEAVPTKQRCFVRRYVSTVISEWLSWISIRLVRWVGLSAFTGAMLISLLSFPRGPGVTETLSGGMLGGAFLWGVYAASRAVSKERSRSRRLAIPNPGLRWGGLVTSVWLAQWAGALLIEFVTYARHLSVDMPGPPPLLGQVALAAVLAGTLGMAIGGLTASAPASAGIMLVGVACETYLYAAGFPSTWLPATTLVELSATGGSPWQAGALSMAICASAVSLRILTRLSKRRSS